MDNATESLTKRSNTVTPLKCVRFYRDTGRTHKMYKILKIEDLDKKDQNKKIKKKKKKDSKTGLVPI